MTELVAGLDNERPDLLSDNDCTLLAYYSWGQDMEILAEKDAGAAYRSMYEACPSHLKAERSILVFFVVGRGGLAPRRLKKIPVPLTAAQKAEALTQVDALLADDELIKANIFTAVLGGARLATALTEAGTAERDALIADFYDVLDRVAADESIYKRERIYTLAGKSRLERIDDPEAELSAELKDEIRAMVKWADESTPSVYERQPIINALGNVLEDAGMDEVAKPLLLAELDISKEPYYFMVGLADIEQRAENYDAAVLTGSSRPTTPTTGPATRFQWGYYYLAGLIEMKPEETALIHSVTVGLIDELQNSGGLYHRPKSQLGRMEQRLIAWSEEYGHAAELAEIRSSVQTICETAAHQDESRETCDAFLEQV